MEKARRSELRAWEAKDGPQDRRRDRLLILLFWLAVGTLAGERGVHLRLAPTGEVFGGIVFPDPLMNRQKVDTKIRKEETRADAASKDYRRCIPSSR
jgi:hypothetical protein